jgi:hypothetical protein
MRLALRRQLTGPNMRAHFTICPKRPAASDNADPRGRNLEAKPAGHVGECRAVGAESRNHPRVTRSVPLFPFSTLIQMYSSLVPETMGPQRR